MVLSPLQSAARSLGLEGCRTLVAVSGGVDSVVLLQGLHELAPRLRLELIVGHVNHGLRAEADADEAWVRDLATRLGLPVRVRRVDPAALRVGGSSRARPTLEEAARTLRYRALRAMAEQAGAARIATAHHAGDQAETVLLRLLRGTGPDGLGGIPECSADGRVVRPLLGVERPVIERFARERGLAWRHDRMNEDPRFARSRLRRDWLPGLAAHFNPRALRAIADLAEAQRRDAEWMAALVQREAASRITPVPDAVGGELLRIERKDWGSLPEALIRRLARRMLAQCGVGREASRVHLKRIVAFLRDPRTGARIELPGGLTLWCERDSFRIRRAPFDP